MKMFEFRQKKFTEVGSHVFIWQYVNIGSGNGLAPIREATIWTNADPVQCRIYAALGEMS